MSNALQSKGTKLQYDSGSGDYVSVAEVTRITGPNPSKEQIDVTHLESTGAYREYIDSFKDGGEITAEVNFIPAAHEDILDDFNADTQRNWRIVWPDLQTQWLFAANVRSISPSASVGEKLSATITLKVSGAIAQGAYPGA